jgi:2-aminoadipate transaminase
VGPGHSAVDLARGELPPEVIADVAPSLDLARLLRDGYSYADRMGSRQLRVAYVDRLARIAKEPAAALVTHGALGAVDLLLRAWAPEARRFVCFDPAYREALHIARRHRLPLVGLRRAGRAIDWDHLTRTLRPGDVCYVVPAANNPDGRTLSNRERELLATAIADAGAMLIEDDAYGLLPEDAPWLPSVAGLVLRSRPDARAVRLFSFSKILIPGARVCVLEGGRSTVAELDAAKLDFGTSPLASTIVAAVLLDDALWRTVVARVRDRLAEGRRAAARALAGWPVPIDLPDDGYFIWLPLGDVPSARFVTTADETARIRLADGSPFLVGAGASGAGAAAPNFVRLSVSWEAPSIVGQACLALGATLVSLIGDYR